MARFAKLRSLLLAAAAFAAAVGHAALPSAHPVLRIPVAPLGFTGPARLYMPYRIPQTTLGFLDANHLLFTFHVSRLMHHEDADTPGDLIQTIHAVVLALPDGKPVAQADWRLHDRDHYLWTLGDGTFLLRQRNALYSGNASLRLTSYLNPPGQWVFGMLSPDHKLFEAEFSSPAPVAAAEGDSASSSAPTLGDDAPRFTAHPKRYSIFLVNTVDRVAQRIDNIPHPVILTLMPEGYLTAEQTKSREYAIQLNPWKGPPRKVASVTSTCSPSLDALSDTVLLATTCLPYTDDHVVEGFDLSGKQLWQQLWQSRFTWGTYAFSRSGDRFAYGSIEMDHAAGAGDAVGEDSVLGQPVGVFETETGKMDLVLDANPVMTAGDNFALSPDGNRLAILREGALEIYDLPQLAPPPAAAGR